MIASRPSLSLLLASVCATAAHAQLTVTEFPVPTANSRPYTIVAGPDGNLWFTESVGNKIGRITPSGTITEFPVPSAGSGPYGIAVGADGNIWFTERFADQIGRLDPDTGAIVEFPVLTGFSQPWDITLGADGNLWFTETEVNQIGRIKPQGTVTEFVPPACCFPIGIGTGTDGNTWFALEIGDQIGRVDQGGNITMYPIQSVQVLPWDVAPGADGAVWFTELAGRAIGRIDASGQITEHVIPGDFSGIAGVAAGPDGKLWFTENDTHHVGAIDTAGNLVELLDVGERPLSIAHGPDGNMWFTLADENALGRVNLAQPGKHHVLSLDCAFVPRLRAAKLGERVQWTFLGPRQHSVVDASGIGFFDSGARSIVSYFEFPCRAAATYAYSDGVGDAPDAAITVPVDLPSSGNVGVAFTVTWAVAAAPSGLAYDVQVKEPGSPTFVTWTSGTARRGNYTASVPGIHRFRARVRETASGDVTIYSRPAQIVVN